MTLEEWSAIGQIVSGIGVVASLIFVGIQVQQNTRATRAQIRENIIGDWAAVAPLLIANPKVFSTGIAGSEDEFLALSNEDKLVFMTQAFMIFKHYENMFLQYEAGYLDKKIWDAWANHILMYFHQRGIQNWWKQRGMNYSPQFRAFLEASQPPQMVSQAALFDLKPKELAEPAPAR